MNLSIQSPGLLDPLAISLMGVSSKRGDDSKIGRFGTGLKYAIAYLLRNGHPLRLFVGLEEIPIAVEPVTFRGETFHRIFIAGEATSITTEMGPDWQLWQAIRELYCNALDEGEAEPCRGKEPKEGHTTFLIGNCEPIVREFPEYFPLKADVLASTPHGEIIAARSSTVYKQRVQVHTGQQYTFSYNFSELALNEERGPRSEHDVMVRIAKVLLGCTNRPLIQMALVAPEWNIIQDYTLWQFPATLMSAEWLDYLEDIIWADEAEAERCSRATLAKITIVHNGLAKFLRVHKLGHNVFEKHKDESETRLEPTAIQLSMIAEALRVAAEANLPIPYSISVFRFSSGNIFGKAEEGEIRLAEITFDRGQQFVLSTILEEYIHLKYRVADYTREFQDIALELLAQRIMRG